MKNKGQVTIFIILAIIIVAGVALFFLFRSGAIPQFGGEEFDNPIPFMESCIGEKMEENLALSTSQGGFVDPEFFKINNDVKATYLCYNRGLFDSCINQHPVYITEITEDLESHIEPVIEDCYLQLESSLEEGGADVRVSEVGSFDITLALGKVFLDLNRKITVSRTEDSLEINEINLVYPSKIYDLAKIAAQISRDESKYCNFNFINYMGIHPETEVDLRVMSDQSKVYTIKDKKTLQNMSVAIRGCALI